MQFSEYQTKSKVTAIYPHDTAVEYVTLGLVGEAGEVANVVKKAIRDDGGVLTEDRINHLVDELGDVMWYMARLLHHLEIPMELVLERNIEKLLSRKERGTIGGSGDDR